MQKGVRQQQHNYLQEAGEFTDKLSVLLTDEDQLQLTNTGYFEKEIMDEKMKHKNECKEDLRIRAESRDNLQELYKRRLEDKKKWGLDLALFSYPLKINLEDIDSEYAD